MSETMWSRVSRGRYEYPINKYMEPAEYHRVKDYTSLLVRESIRFEITPVSDFLYQENDREDWDWTTDFPNVAPPYPLMWMEYKTPRTIRSEGKVTPFGDFTSSNASFIFGLPAEHGMTFLDQMRAKTPEDRRAYPHKRPDGAKWLVAMSPFADVAGRGVFGPLAIMALWADEHGKPMDGPTIMVYAEKIAGDQEALESLTSSGFPFALALSFLHCKNVTVVDMEDRRSRQERRADERRGAMETKFKTLVIEPMRRVLKTEGESETLGLQRALHICRGHFANYSEEKPLFGKHTGQFWVPAHVRGTREAGLVVKDYEVKAP